MFVCTLHVCTFPGTCSNALCHFDQEKELGIISTHNIDERGRIVSGKSATCSSVSNIGNSRTHAVL